MVIEEAAGGIGKGFRINDEGGSDDAGEAEGEQGIIAEAVLGYVGGGPFADELEQKYDATINAAVVREAAEVYEGRKMLKRF